MLPALLASIDKMTFDEESVTTLEKFFFRYDLIGSVGLVPISTASPMLVPVTKASVLPINLDVGDWTP
ncbi:hypothetical protein D3C71_1914810 [compost metagenome]